MSLGSFVANCAVPYGLDIFKCQSCAPGFFRSQDFRTCVATCNPKFNLAGTCITTCPVEYYSYKFASTPGYSCETAATCLAKTNVIFGDACLTQTTCYSSLSNNATKYCQLPTSNTAFNEPATATTTFPCPAKPRNLKSNALHRLCAYASD